MNSDYVMHQATPVAEGSPQAVLPAAGPPPDITALAASAGPGSEVYKQVEEQLRRVANFLFFSMPNKTQPNVPIMSNGQLVGVEVHENLHRFEIKQQMAPAGLRVRNRVGQPAAQVHMTWRPIPDDFEAYPGVDIPATPLDPTRSQRFMMHDGRFTIDDAGKSGFRGFGTGRTFPVVVDGKPQLRIAAVVDVAESLGELAGHDGMLLVNGHIEPPYSLALSIMLRLTDPAGKLASSRIPALKPLRGPEPDHDDLYLVFLGYSDPEDPVKIKTSGGAMQGATGPQRMRLIDIAFNVKGRRDIRSKSKLGAIAGKMDATAWFNPFSGEPPYPFQTTNGVFTFRGGGGEVIGTLEADMVEGRAMPTEIPGAPMPVYRVGGMAPASRGTGCFAGAAAIFTVNSFISLVPNVISGIFVLHLTDPSGKVRAALGAAQG